ncbi:hypothetical protein D3C81_1485480 [compost metagenome]
MADGPAVLVVDEIDGSKQLPGWHLGLGPGLALVIGKQDMATITDGDQARASLGDVQQQAFYRLGRFGGVDIGLRGCGFGRVGP